MNREILFRNAKISFTDKGKGRVVVLLHGFLGSKEIWNRLHTILAVNFRVIAVDLPGHGSSDCFGYQHSMKLMAQAVNEVMNSLNLKQYVIIGHSMGGYVALSFAELYSEKLRGLCLFHSSSLADSEQKKIDRGRAVMAVKSNHDLFVKETITHLFSPNNIKSHEKEILFAKEIANNISMRGMVAALEGMKDRLPKDHILKYAKFSIMMVIGKQDNVFKWSDLLDQANYIKNKTVLLLENSGHMGFIEETENCALELKKFIRKCFRD
jgi:pimeloyl-ACP methyl ester carboxylesterase